MDDEIHFKKQHHSLSISKDYRLNRSLLYFIFLPALCVVFIISLLTYHQVKRLIVANQWVVHTYRVIKTTDGALNAISDIESHQSGYLITGDVNFLAEVDHQKIRLKKKFDQLLHLTKDNPSQNKRITQLINVSNERLALLTQILQMKINNKLNAQEGLDLINRGEDVSNQLKDLGREIKSIESVLLKERNTRAMNRAHMSSSILIAGNTFSLLIIILAVLFVNQQLTRSLREEQERKNIEARLRSILESASDMIAAIDSNRQFIIYNEAYQNEFKRLFKKHIEVGMTIEEATSESLENKNIVLDLWNESLHGIEYTKTIELSLNDEQYIYEITSNFIKNEENKITGAIQVIRNITKRIQEQLELKESYAKLNVGMRELQDKNDQITLLVEMSDIMLACSSQDELSHVMTKYCQRLLNFGSGYLYVMHPSKNYLEMTTTWGKPNKQDITFSPEQCWAIRLGRIHHVNHSQNGLICDHIKPSKLNSLTSYCVPLMAQNDIYGLLYLEMDIQRVLNDNQKLLMSAFSELTALALANVRLRENLRFQSIRDPLTGLYNRRYLEDFLVKQINQSERANVPLSVLMLDLDHFKKINDTYGHDAGDAVLKELGKVLIGDIRVGDTAARYGGEEFIVVFYNSDLETVKQRAEKIRHSVSMLQIKYGAQDVGPITISIGISGYPMHGQTPAELIESADRALYLAKKNGRNQVVIYSNF